MRVPESIKVTVDGPLAPGVSAKDVMLRLIGDLTADGATYCSVEFDGSFISGLSVSERMTLCNLAMELGAKFAYVPPDDVTPPLPGRRGACRATATTRSSLTRARPTSAWSRWTAPALSPQIACPHTVDNVKPVEEVAGKHVDQVFIGSCANAKYEDLAEAAADPARPPRRPGHPADRDARLEAGAAAGGRRRHHDACCSTAARW